MAGGKAGVWRLQLKSVQVPKCMSDGEKFIKWDEDSGLGNPVTLKVDSNGFFLFWTNQNNEVDLLDIAFIRDTRSGKGAKVPKEGKLKQIVNLGSTDTLEEKTLTVVHGPDFVNLSYTNFCATKKETAKLWADELLEIATNLLQLNSPAISFLIKIHTKLTICSDKQGLIPVKNIVKVVAKDKEDRKRIEKALDSAGIPSGKNDSVHVNKFGFEEFFTFYKNITVRPEVERVFDDFSGFNKKKLMTADQFMEFINKEQRDPRLNEILYPYTTPEKANELIQIYEPNTHNANKNLLSLDGFLRYILSEENQLVSMEKYDLSDDMDHPLNHYFINSSHNTYLIGHQLTGKSSVEMYRQTLLAGCRCVELDFWNGSGKKEEPTILHGYTLVPDLKARDVLEAIAESAFKTSEYPVILSFENHCNTKQQAKIAQYCKELFGPMLLEFPIEGYPLESGKPLPPPSFLKRRIIIKNKKKHRHHKQKPQKKISKSIVPENGESPPLLKEDSKESVENEQVPNAADEESSISSDEEEDSTEPDDSNKDVDTSQSDKGTAGEETEAGAEISALVNYVQPVHFYTFEHSQKRNRSYEMSSFDEKMAMTLLKERPVEFVNYNKHQLSRIYPRGTRVDSANFMPQLFWNFGCQLVALNYQTLDLPMQLNLGIFELNRKSGYLLKPEFMRRKDRRFDPFAESTVDGIIAGHVCIQVISGQFLTEKRVGTYVEVDMLGLPADTVRKRFRTKIVPLNGINPLYDEEPFVFKKVVLPDLACIRIAAYEESGKMIGHRVLPVVGLRPGFRHVILRNESGQSLNLATLFLYIRVKDYVPDGFQDFAEALANPIKYQSELEKRAKQLSVLQDDMMDDSNDENSEPIIPVVASTGGAVNSSNSPGGVSSSKAPLLSKMSIKRKDTANLVSCSPPSSMGGMSSTISERSSGILSGGVRSESFDDHHQRVKPSISIGSSGASLEIRQSTGDRSSISSAISGMSGIGLPSGYIDAAKSVIQLETLEKFLDSKVIREKRNENDKKLEAVRKKNDLARIKAKVPKSHQKLVKKLSSRNLKESTNETLISQQIQLEREIQDKGHEEIVHMLENLIRSNQAKQIKLLVTIENKDNVETMEHLDKRRKDECKKMKKETRDRRELDRKKRELDTKLVEQGVQIRKMKKHEYDQFRGKLEKDHLEVLEKLEEWKRSMTEKLKESLRKRQLELEEELRQHSTNTNPHSN